MCPSLKQADGQGNGSQQPTQLGLTDSEGDFSKGDAEVREKKNGRQGRLDQGAQKR